MYTKGQKHYFTNILFLCICLPCGLECLWFHMKGASYGFEFVLLWKKKKKQTGSKFLIKTNLEKITNLSTCSILGLSWVLKSFTISCDPFCLRKQNISFMSSLALLVHHLIWIRMTSMHSTVGIMNHKLTQWETLPQSFTAVPQVWILHVLLLTLLQLWM